jgi:DNA mismatch repair protein MutS2
MIASVFSSRVMYLHVLEMTSRFAPGDTVQTRFGKGVVREVRNSGRLLVDVQGSAIVVTEKEISAVDPGHTRARAGSVAPPRGVQHNGPKREARRAFEVDLHGLTVEEALDRMQRALNEALLADVGELRLIHGRSGGRIRAALYRRLQETPTVRFRLDPRNEGVTIVSL